MNLPECPDLPVEFRATRGRVLLLLLLGIGFVAIGLLMTLYPGTFVSSGYRSPTFIQFIGAICALFFGFCVIKAVRLLIDNQPSFTFTAEGIALPNGGLARWTNIRDVQVITMHRQTFVRILLKDLESFYASLKPAAAHMSRINANLAGGAPFALQPNHVGVAPEVLVAWVKQNIPQPGMSESPVPTRM
ncbi:STM3941 family protein [Nitrospirillum viridazoti]|uniref:Uncharacterized protein n=1 Tax=Nitrospirillum viridazoti CBAmc TaxID=1441467 RepID=A0A248JME4_9PROT|nr:STM3941 family protein [Nitrospirillum amazonense]ASG19875.1 hypothetical protein Y958_02780 [Nitrospirillum amazonense CBAmc]TWB30426.1 hypothetical protein FBZ91_12276 [Nitrospirillum amazonense]